jgi:hypothetical protein
MAGAAPEFDLVQTWENPFPHVEGADPDKTSFAFFRLYQRQWAGT